MGFILCVVIDAYYSDVLFVAQVNSLFLDCSLQLGVMSSCHSASALVMLFNFYHLVFPTMVQPALSPLLSLL